MCRSCEKNCVSFYRPRNIENEIFEAAGPLENEKQLFECNYCHRKFIYKSWLEGHIQKMHLMVKYECEICGAVFNRQDNLKRHTNYLYIIVEKIQQKHINANIVFPFSTTDQI